MDEIYEEMKMKVQVKGKQFVFRDANEGQERQENQRCEKPYFTYPSLG
jgi:hypothetical protein